MNEEEAAIVARIHELAGHVLDESELTPEDRAEFRRLVDRMRQIAAERN